MSLIQVACENSLSYFSGRENSVILAHGGIIGSWKLHFCQQLTLKYNHNYVLGFVSTNKAAKAIYHINLRINQATAIFFFLSFFIIELKRSCNAHNVFFYIRDRFKSRMTTSKQYNYNCTTKCYLSFICSLLIVFHLPNRVSDGSLVMLRNRRQRYVTDKNCARCLNPCLVG